MIVKLLTEQSLEFLSLKGGCTGLSESTLVKKTNCWKSYKSFCGSYFPVLRQGCISITSLKSLSDYPFPVLSVLKYS